MSSLNLAISGRLMECSAALLKSRLHATARPSRALYPPRSLKLGTDSKLMCLPIAMRCTVRSHRRWWREISDDFHHGLLSDPVHRNLERLPLDAHQRQLLQ